MRTLVALLVVLLATAPATTPALPRTPPATSVAPADRAEVDSLLRRWEKAWADGDAAAWSSLFHEDGVWVLWTGAEWRGRTRIAAELAWPFATVYKDSIQLSRPFELRMVAPDVMVVRTMTRLTGDPRQPGVTIHGKKLLVLTRRDGRWLILYGQNTRLTEAEVAKLR